MTNAGWQPDPYDRYEVRYFDGTQWTDHVSDAGVQSVDPEGPRVNPVPPPNPAPVKKSHTVRNVLLGMLLGTVVLIGGCAALIGGAANEVQKESDRTSITLEQYRSLTTGEVTEDEVRQMFGEPSNASEFSSEIEGLDQPVGSSCVYYNRKGEILSLFQLCFDINTKKLESKTSI